MKRERQRALLELIRREPLGSQGEIRERLLVIGHEATQSTISRDLEELGLVRVRDGTGNLRYAEAGAARPTQAGPRMQSLLSELALSVESSGNVVVIRTLPGAANAVAEAMDRAEVDGILATVAGDDTILAVVRKGARGGAVARRLRELGRLG